MSTIAGDAAIRRAGSARMREEERFFFVSALVMAAVLVAGFSLQLAFGRSTFASPVRYHLHAAVFFGWVTLYVMQNVLAARGSLALHRRLGWLAALWVPLMTFSGLYMTVVTVAAGRAPPFFQPGLFLSMNSLHILSFAGLAAASLFMRRDTQWHRRLMFCAMAELLGPGLGRLLPMPFLVPWAHWAVFIPAMLFPLAGVIRDLRRQGRVHNAWWWGMGVMLGAQLLIGPLARSEAGAAIYAVVTSGSPAVPPALEFPVMPPAP